MKTNTTIIYAVAFLRTVASAISGFAIEVFVRLSGASDIAISFVAAVPSITYMLAALFLSGRVNKLGQRLALLISSAVTFLATLLYTGIFVAMEGIAMLVTAVLLIEAAEGLFAGWFWPVLQTRLGDNAREDGREIRVYNLSWNLGIILGSVLVVSYAGVSADPRVLFPIVLQVLAWSIAINGVIFGLIWAKFVPERRTGTPEVVGQLAPKIIPTIEDPRKYAAGVPVSVWVSLAALFAFAFNVGGILTNVFNQLTAVSATPVMPLNLLPWIPIIDTTRQMTQLGASGVHKSVGSSSQEIIRIITLMSVLAGLLGFASQMLARGGIYMIVFAVGMHGILSGMLYNTTMQVILHDTPANRRGRFQGIYEAVLGMGFFAGPVVAGVLSEVSGYLVSYRVLAGISFLMTAVLVSVQAREASDKAMMFQIVPKLSPRQIPPAMRFVLVIAGLWVGLRMVGYLAPFQIIEGVTLAFVVLGAATVVLLKPRSDLMQAFDRFRSRRPHVLAMCTPNSKYKRFALAPPPFEVIPLVPC